MHALHERGNSGGQLAKDGQRDHPVGL